MRRIMIGTGWKMNLGLQESLNYVKVLQPLVTGITEIDIFVLPSFIALPAVSVVLQGSHVDLGAQNMFWEERGAFTGEISPAMLVECGCRYVELGHQERRRLFAETDDTVGKKARAAWDHNLIPIVCIGEINKAEDPQEAATVLKRQISLALGQLTPEEVKNTVLAYEPAWAIGLGKEAAEPDYANKIHQVSRQIVTETFGKEAGESIRIIYGGSVNQENAVSFLQKAEIDGLFVGRAALDPKGFAKFVHVGISLAPTKNETR